MTPPLLVLSEDEVRRAQAAIQGESRRHHADRQLHWHTNSDICDTKFSCVIAEEGPSRLVLAPHRQYRAP